MITATKPPVSTMLDRLDRLILHALDTDATQSLSKIAKRLRLGSDLVEYRMRRFYNDGIISRFTPFINPAALGFGIYKTYIRHRLPPKQLKALLKRLDSHERIHWFTEGYGRWDLLFSFNARNFAEYQRLYDEQIGALGKYIIDQGVYPLISAYRFPKDYLTEDVSTAFYWSSDEAVGLVDEFEQNLLAELAIDARMSDAELARRLNSTAAIVNYRRNKLESGRVIVGYRMQFDYSTLGMTVIKVFLELKNYAPSVRKAVLEFCRKEPRVTCFVQQIGNYPIEFEVEVESYDQFSGVVDRLREQFAVSISRFDHMILTKDHFHRVPHVVQGVAFSKFRPA